MSVVTHLCRNSVPDHFWRQELSACPTPSSVRVPRRSTPADAMLTKRSGASSPPVGRVELKEVALKGDFWTERSQSRSADRLARLAMATRRSVCARNAPGNVATTMPHPFSWDGQATSRDPFESDQCSRRCWRVRHHRRGSCRSVLIARISSRRVEEVATIR
jgi:hypothetical protein